MYISDYGNNCIRKVSTTTLISTIAGSTSASFSGDNGAATSATLNSPSGIALDSSSNVYIADYGNSRIRKITVSTGVINTIAGTGVSSYGGDGGQATSAAVKQSHGVALDSSGNVYIADTGNFRIRKVTVSTGIISTIAGTSVAGYYDDGMDATSATLAYPTGLHVDSSVNIFIADWINNRIRKVTASGTYSPTPKPSETPSLMPTSTEPPSNTPTIVPSSTSPSTAIPRYAICSKYRVIFIAKHGFFIVAHRV